jgi:hypothetical protein
MLCWVDIFSRCMFRTPFMIHTSDHTLFYQVTQRFNEKKENKSRGRDAIVRGISMIALYGVASFAAGGT